MLGAMTEMVQRSWNQADLGRMVSRATFKLVVAGREDAWVRSVVGSDPQNAQVEISLDQLILHGTLGAIRERLAAMVELLDEVAAHPERWKDLHLTRIGEQHWRRGVPHPFLRRGPQPQLPLLEPHS